ncbi:AMP-binding protein [Pseudooceanicola sp. HF7]|nr:AMP-binding protein [Pseudooceanicola sp. HF7]NIZ08105.1 AMP-binding protein [Pseudooceanicola sp. HF7]
MRTRGVAWWPATGDGDLVDQTLGELLKAQAERFGSRTAVVFIDSASGARTSWTYAEMLDGTARLARGLIAWGVKAGDHVAVMAANRPEWIELEFALARIGAVLVTVNPALHAREVSYLLSQGRITHLIHADRFRKQDLAAMVAELLAGTTFPDMRGICALDGDADMTFAALGEMAASVSEADLAEREAAVRPGDTMQIQYTSGTTGRPKGAMLSHHSTVNNARLMGQRGDFGPDDVLLSAMPLFHTAGCVCNVIGMMACGGCLVVLDSYEPGAMLAAWQSEGATIINGVPTMYARMLDHPDFASFRTDSLRIAFMGGTSIPPSLMRRVCQQVDAQPMIIMGMTECSPIITQTDPQDSFETRIASAGIPMPHTEVRIIDPETGAPVGWGEKGELCIRGYLLTKGYFDMPDKTAETIDAEGWLHSGDLAVLEETGHLSIVGRLKDMIIRGGENVFPVEIEDFLLEHPDIAQAQVVGVPDADLGEEIFAFVLPVRDATITAAEVQAYCRDGMARHKMPKYVQTLDAFPMTPNGKVQKYTLRTMALDLTKEDVPT